MLLHVLPSGIQPRYHLPELRGRRGKSYGLRIAGNYLRVERYGPY